MTYTNFDLKKGLKLFYKKETVELLESWQRGKTHIKTTEIKSHIGKGLFIRADILVRIMKSSDGWKSLNPLYEIY